MNLVTKTYGETANFPDSEKYGLVSQIRRSAVSIPSNIAEGYGRNSNGEFQRYLNYFNEIFVRATDPNSKLPKIWITLKIMKEPKCMI